MVLLHLACNAIYRRAAVPIIQSIEVCAARVPPDNAASFSSRTVTGRHYGLVEIRSGEVTKGTGFRYVGSAAGEIFRVAAEQLLAPMQTDTVAPAPATAATPKARLPKWSARKWPATWPGALRL